MALYSHLIVKHLRFHLGEPKVGAEVGAWIGGTTNILLRAFPKLKLYVVDPWDGGDVNNTTAVRTTPENVVLAKNTFFQKTSWAEERLTVFCMDSLLGCSKITELLDFAFIDGDHRYEAVKADLAAWWPKIRNGGTLIGHDYRKDVLGDIGVIEATNEFISEHGLKLTMLSKNMYAINKD
jgi:predicted O-methyltransferase YrrM